MENKEERAKLPAGKVYGSDLKEGDVIKFPFFVANVLRPSTKTMVGRASYKNRYALGKMEFMDIQNDLSYELAQRAGKDDSLPEGATESEPTGSDPAPNVAGASVAGTPKKPVPNSLMSKLGKKS